MGEKDTVFPVSKGTTQHHLPGQNLHLSVMGMQALSPLPGPLPITEVCLEHSDSAELLSQLCNRENNSNAASPSPRLGNELEASFRQDEHGHYWQKAGVQGCSYKESWDKHFLNHERVFRNPLVISLLSKRNGL